MWRRGRTRRVRWRGLRARLHRRHRGSGGQRDRKAEGGEGPRSEHGKGAGIRAAHFLLGPAAIGIGVLGGGRAGPCITKGLGLTDYDRERIGKERANGNAAVGVLTSFNESSMISAKLGELSGASEEHTVSDEALKADQ
jgi:hypothetical protein